MERRTDLLTVTDMAERLGVSRASVYRLMRTGDLAFIQIGGRRKFSPKVVDEFLKRQERRVVQRRRARKAVH